MTRISVERVKAKLDTHEAVCAERWKETILRIKRLEAIFIAFSGATMLMLVSIIIKQLQEDIMKTGYGYVNKHNDHDYKADGKSVVREGERRKNKNTKINKNTVVREGERKYR